MRSAFHERAFRWLLRLYPAEFRDAYGEDMCAFFLQRLGRARARGGRLAVPRYWLSALIDVIRTAATERASQARRVATGAAAPRGAPRRRGEHPVTSFIHDVHYASRRLRRSPLFT